MLRASQGVESCLLLIVEGHSKPLARASIIPQREQASSSRRRSNRHLLPREQSHEQAQPALRVTPERIDGRLCALRDKRSAQRGSRRRRRFLLQRRASSARLRLRRLVSSPAIALWPPQQGAVADSFWVSLKYFNFYR